MLAYSFELLLLYLLGLFGPTWHVIGWVYYIPENIRGATMTDPHSMQELAILAHIPQAKPSGKQFAIFWRSIAKYKFV